jgi:hypothetical protein
MDKPNCRKCRHFLITWNPKSPHGCRKYGIQTKDEPSKIIAMAGMGECQGFESKINKNEVRNKLDLNRDDLW